jgi:hypothetical protein
MNVRTNLLAGFRRSKDSDDRNFGFFADLRRPDIVSEEGIELTRRSLVIVDAVQPDTKEEVHCEEDVWSGGRIRSRTAEYIVDGD